MNKIGKVLLVILGIWLAISLFGFLIKGLFWLGVIGGLAFLITLVFSGSRKAGIKY